MEANRRKMRTRPKGRIITQLYLGYAAVVVLLVVLAGLTFYGLSRSDADLLRARQSLAQLENARAIEGAFNLYLFEELSRRLTPAPGAEPSEASLQLTEALSAYRKTIQEEVAGDTSDTERNELVRAAALTDLFVVIEDEAAWERSTNQAGNPDRAAFFLNQIAGNRDEVFSAVVFEILQDERAEARSAFSSLEGLRSTLVLTGGLLAGAFAIVLAGFAYLFYRGLLHPIRRLGAAAEGFDEAGAIGRAPEDLPHEFARLAQRFNRMAEVIEGNQQRLKSEVAARTAELEAANSSLTRIDKARRAFFASVSHELRTPVTILRGEAQIGLKVPGDERGALERIEANSGYLKRRLDDLLKLARSDDGELDLKPEPISLDETIAAAVAAAEAYARANEAEIVFDQGPPSVITADQEAVRTAVLALIDNAVKFSPPGGVITVTFTVTGFSVEDQGPGFGDISPDQLFERYAQSGEGRNLGGAGLGLAIVKWIADKHGATLTAQDRETGGARIQLEFPT